MKSLCRYLTRITLCLGIWIIAFPGQATGNDSNQLTTPVNARESADGEGKITIMNSATKSPQKQIHLSGNIRQHPPATNNAKLIRSSQKQQSTTKMQAQRTSSKRIQEPVAKYQASDDSFSVIAPPVPEKQRVIETQEIQETKILQEPIPADPIPLVAEALPQPFYDGEISPVIEKGDSIQTVSINDIPGYAQHQIFTRDTAKIITRLLLKFSLITVCCSALFFSFSALQIAKSNQRNQCRIGEENDKSLY